MSEVLTYTEAEALHAKARNKERGKVLDHNTWLVKRDGYYAVVLHKTAIVKIYPKDVYELNSGGWHTMTTKERINRFSPVCLFANKGLWYFDGYVFEDGIKVDKNGKPIGKVVSLDDIEAKKTGLDKEVSAFVKRFCEHLKKNGMEDPSAGDCWLCGMLSKAGDYTNVDHLISHMEEDYFVPRLLFEAVSEHVRGRSWQGAMPDEKAEQCIATRWHIMKTDVRYRSRESGAALRRYFMNRKSELLKVFNAKAFAKKRKERAKVKA